MLIKNAKAYLDNQFIPGTDVRIQEGIVTEIGQLSVLDNEEIIDAQGRYLIPGFVDVHTHGCVGKDTMRGEDDIRAISRFIRSQGVAAFLPTTMSASVEEIHKALAAVRKVMDCQEDKGAYVLGAHMEAPFLAPTKCGAQVKEYFMNPAMTALYQMTGGDYGSVRLITMAPEREGSKAFIREAVAHGITVSVGHTEATAEQTHEAADWGASHITHCFNAMTGLTHREPGVPGASMVDDRYFNEMICDGIHLHPDTLKVIMRCKGAAHTVAVTDSMEAAGMPNGQYELGGQPVFVKDGAARLENGVLAGSVLTMCNALRNLIKFGFAPEDAVRMTTQSPAESIDEHVFGKLQVGLPVPVTLWDDQWTQMTVVD